MPLFLLLLVLFLAPTAHAQTGPCPCGAATTGVADNDTGAPAANDVIVNIFYK
jgi:hypothetical protein